MKTMLKCFTAALFCVSTTICAHDLPQIDRHTLQLGTAIDYELPSKQPQILSNVFKWTVTADCKLIETEQAHELTFKVLRKKISFNEIILSRGEKITAFFKPLENVHMSVEPGATLEITNQDDESLKIRCVAETN